MLQYVHVDNVSIDVGLGQQLATSVYSRLYQCASQFHAYTSTVRHVQNYGCNTKIPFDRKVIQLNSTLLMIVAARRLD